VTHFFWSAPWALAAVAVVGWIFTGRRLAAARRAAEDGDRTSGTIGERVRLAEQVARFGTWSWDPATGRFTLSGGAADLCGLGHDPVDVGVEALYTTIHPEDRTTPARPASGRCGRARPTRPSFLSKPLDIGTLRDALLQCAPRQRDAA